MTSFLQRITGPALVSWPVLVLVVVWSTALNLLGAGPTVSGGLALRAVAAALAGALSFALVVGAWYAVIRRCNGPVRIVAVTITLLLAGLVRGAALQFLLVTFALTDDSTASALVRLVSSAVTIPMAFVIGAAALGAIVDYRADAATLVSEQQRLGQLLDASARGLEERRTDAVQRIQAQLDDEISRLPVDDAPATVQALESLAGDVVRPLSHELARDLPEWSPETPSLVPDVPWADVFRAPDAAQAIRPGVLTLVMATIGIPGALLVYTPVRGLIALAGAVLVLWACLAIGRRWLAARPPRTAAAAWLRIGAVLAVATLLSSAAVGVLDVGDRGQGAFSRLALVAIPVFGLLVAIMSMLGARMRNITSELAEVNRDLRWSLARINTESWEQNGRLSRALHGPVQSLLHARLLNLRRALEADGTSASDIESLRADLQRSLAAALSPSDSPVVVEDVLRDVSGTWAGLAEVGWWIDEDAAALLADDPLCSEAVTDLATEAVSNSIRHGHATSVDVRIDMSDDNLLRLRVIDNGIATDKGLPGLGTVLLTRCTFDWSLSRDEPTTLTARLPLQARERTPALDVGGA